MSRMSVKKREIPFCLHSGSETNIREGSYLVIKSQQGSREAVESFLKSPKDYGSSEEFMKFV